MSNIIKLNIINNTNKEIFASYLEDVACEVRSYEMDFEYLTEMGSSMIISLSEFLKKEFSKLEKDDL